MYDSASSAAIVSELPPVPPADLDPYLDAAARCFERYGIKRTTVPDAADEAGVSRATFYRRVGTIADAARMLLAREVHRLLTTLTPELRDLGCAEDLVGIASRVIGFVRDDPVFQKVLADEVDLVGPFVVEELPRLLGRVADVVAPLLADAMERGALAPTDPRILAEWLVRATVSVVLAPPPGDVEAFLEPVLLPALRP